MDSLIEKQYNESSVFTPENLLREARRQKNIQECPVPDVCVLDPDGDLVEFLIRTNQATMDTCWACYHTKLYKVSYNGIEFGIIGCGVGGAFAVLIAEQLFVSGCKTLISITSAGIINDSLNNYQFILINQAIRDEGTSHHYLPANETAEINQNLMNKLNHLFTIDSLSVDTGISWTTDAPYRETPTAIGMAKKLNAKCVEMEAAGLYAFAKSRGKDIVCFAHLTNTMAQATGDFEKGEEMGSLASLSLIVHTVNALKKDLPEYWDNIYDKKKPDEMSWTQASPAISLDFIRSFGLDKQASIIDIGGGDSKLVDNLLEEGYKNITILDISAKALEKAKLRLGVNANKIKWIVTDITQFQTDAKYDIWHDRATFHFLTAPAQINKYIEIARKAVTAFMTIGTFSDKGPKKCSGLPVKQYSEEELSVELANGFNKMKCITENHITPFNTVQHFLFCSFKKQI